jgi:hypothetical protein
MGITLANEPIKAPLKVIIGFLMLIITASQFINTSSFSVTYTLHLSRDGERNFNRINPFSVVPCRLTLDAGAEAVIAYS